MGSFRPLLKWGFGTHLQMAELHGLYMGVILTTYIHWDDPSSTTKDQLVKDQLVCKYLEPLCPLFAGAPCLQNKAQTPIKTRVI